MSKSIKPTSNTFIDSSGIVYGHETLKTLLNTFEIHKEKNYNDITDFLNTFKTFRGYAGHYGYLQLNGANGFFIGFYQSYGNGYGKVLVFTAWNNYLCTLNNGNWSIGNLVIS